MDSRRLDQNVRWRTQYGRIHRSVRHFARLVAPALVYIPPQLADAPFLAPLRTTILIYLNWALQNYPRNLITRTRMGFVMRGSTDDTLLRWVRVFGTWEPHITSWVKGFLRPGDVVIDVGANAGYYSLLSAHCVGGRGLVYAVEPVPIVLRVLEENLKLNSVNNVRVLQMAASDVAGEVKIYTNSHNLALSSTLPRAGVDNDVIVRKDRLSEHIPQDLWPEIRLVKIDVEGEEVAALRGLTPILDIMPRGAAVIVEIEPKRLAARGLTMRHAQDIMMQSGFADMRLVRNSYNPRDLAIKKSQDPEMVSTLPDEEVDVIFTKL